MANVFNLSSNVDSRVSVYDDHTPATGFAGRGIIHVITKHRNYLLPMRCWYSLGWGGGVLFVFCLPFVWLFVCVLIK
jgi:hypothetical protein